MLKSQGIVRKIVEKPDRILVSFPNHSGYFTLPPDNAEMRALVEESKEKGRELRFTFDRDLLLLSIT